MAGVLVSTLGLLLAGTAPAQAETLTFHGETETIAEYLPCVSEFPSLEGFEITLTFNRVEHFSENKNGGHFTSTDAGTFAAVPVLFADEDGDGLPDFDEATESFVIAGPRDGESFTGRYTLHAGGNFQDGQSTFTFTFSGRGEGDDGTSVRWNSVEHITADGDPFDPAITPKVAFSRFNCR